MDVFFWLKIIYWFAVKIFILEFIILIMFFHGYFSHTYYGFLHRNLRFKSYVNPNFQDFSIFHALQNYELADVNGDKKQDILLGGEHYHLENVVTGMEQKAINWLANAANHRMSRDYSKYQFKLNRYYSFNNAGLMIDNVKKIDNSTTINDCEGQFNSIQSIGVGDYDNDNDMEKIIQQIHDSEIAMAMDESYASNLSLQINNAPIVEDIDLIIGGHTHTFLDKPTVLKNIEGKDVLVNQVGCYGVNLGRIDFYFDSEKSKSSKGKSIIIV
jgi:hypothetical protein